jgi:hypothetical protein
VAIGLVADYDRRAMSVERWHGLGRVLVGSFIVLIAVVKLLNRDTYPAGDWRNDPVAWAAFSGLFVLLGLACVVSGVLPFVRRPFR